MLETLYPFIFPWALGAIITGVCLFHEHDVKAPEGIAYAAFWPIILLGILIIGMKRLIIVFCRKISE